MGHYFQKVFDGRTYELLASLVSLSPISSSNLSTYAGLVWCTSMVLTGLHSHLFLMLCCDGNTHHFTAIANLRKREAIERRFGDRAALLGTTPLHYVNKRRYSMYVLVSIFDQKKKDLL